MAISHSTRVYPAVRTVIVTTYAARCYAVIDLVMRRPWIEGIRRSGTTWHSEARLLFNPASRPKQRTISDLLPRIRPRSQPETNHDDRDGPIEMMTRSMRSPANETHAS